jgi:hypothetical protein
MDQRLFGPASEKLGLADIGLASAGHRFLDDPLEILETLRTPGQNINGILQRHGAHAGDPLADLGAQVERLGRKLVDEQIPVRRALTVPRRGRSPARRAAHGIYIALD